MIWISSMVLLSIIAMGIMCLLELHCHYDGVEATSSSSTFGHVCGDTRKKAQGIPGSCPRRVELANPQIQVNVG